MAAKYGVADYVFQFVTIALGVLIALMTNTWVDWRNDRQLVAEARATITREIADNKKELEQTSESFSRDHDALANALKFASDMLATHKTSIHSLNLHFNLADLSNTSWHTAERTGALSHMDYAEVQKYSKLYDFQDLFIQQQRTALAQLSQASAIISSDFDPDNPNVKDLEDFRERVMQLQATMRIQRDFADRLSKSYDEALKK